MSGVDIVTQCIISSRNILFGGSYNASVMNCLKEVLDRIEDIEVDSTRNIFKVCIPVVIRHVNNSNLLAAGLILNLIHNMPLKARDEERWDLDYFLSMELPEFLENYSKIESSRLITLYVCGQLASSYLLDDRLK